MNRRTFFNYVAAAALVGCSREAEQPAANASPDPAAVVRAIYEPYLGRGEQPPEFRNQAPWSADLRRQLDAMIARSSEMNEPILDFDPFLDAQDSGVTDVNVSTDGFVENSHATVRASFTNLGRATEVLYDLIWEDGAWRIDNMRTSAWNLRDIAAAPATPATP